MQHSQSAAQCFTALLFVLEMRAKPGASTVGASTVGASTVGASTVGAAVGYSVQPLLANWCNTHTLQARTLSAPQFLIRHVFAGMSQWLCLVLMQSDKRQLPACPLLPVLLSLCGCTVVAGRHAHTLLSLKIEPNSAGTDMYGYC